MIPMVLKATSMVLQTKGYEVTQTDTPSSVLELLRSETHNFDVVVTDQMMPEMTGLELAQKIRTSGNTVPIILLTGFCDSIFEDQASGEVDAIHMKPLDFATLPHHHPGPDRRPRKNCGSHGLIGVVRLLDLKFCGDDLG